MTMFDNNIYNSAIETQRKPTLSYLCIIERAKHTTINMMVMS